LLEGLNEAQLAAVQHNEGPLLVVAGAGTGKTQVITRRIARLIVEEKARPEEILALTFTDKAAGEMLDRLDGLVGWQAYRVNVMTFHAFGLQLLQRFGHHMGWSSRTEVIPPLGKLILLKRHLSEVKLSYYGPQADIMDFLQGMVDYIEAMQNIDVDLEQFEQYVDGLQPGPDMHQLDIAELQDRLTIFRLYEKLKQKYGLIDYHDQVQLPLQLLQQKPNLVERLRQEYRYVLVDEYQDTNGAQDGLLRQLVAPGGNIFAVGDDDQAIYGFRGARLSGILEFAEHFGVKRPVTLIENYRSTQPILDAAYKLITHNNPDRLEVALKLDKRLQSQTTGPAPTFVAYPEVRTEADGVAEEIASRVRNGVAAEELAVLATTHQALAGVARSLRQRGVAYQLSSSVNIFEQPEMVQLWHLLRWIGLTADDEALAQLLLGPFIGWPAAKVRALSQQAREQLLSLETVLEQDQDQDEACQELVEKLAAWRLQAKELPISQLVYELVFGSGLSDTWRQEAERTPRLLRVFQDLQVWLQQMQQYEAFALDPKLAGYLGDYPRPPQIEAEEMLGEVDGVRLLTIHAAKGLEFETVFIVNNSADAWSTRSTGRRVTLPTDLQPDVELAPEHERRRLLYVGLTRARRELILSAPAYQKGGRVRRLSPFLPEIFTATELKLPAQTAADNKLEETLQKFQQFATPIPLDPSTRLPFESSDGWLELSTSDLERYDDCPYEFYLEKVLGIRLPLGPQAVFGSLLHDLFHDYYRSRSADDGYNLAQLQQRLDDRWSGRGYPTAEVAQLAHQTATETLVSFYAREEAAKRQLRASEEPFVLSLPEAKLKIKGRIDVSFETPEGIEVRDYKTGRKHDAERLAQTAKDSLQLRTYALAIQEMTGRAPASVMLDYVVTGTVGVATLSPTILANHRAKLAKLADSIRSRQFAPKRSLYHQCVAHRYWGDPQDDDEEVQGA